MKLELTDIKVTKAIGMNFHITRTATTDIPIDKLHRSLRRQVLAHAIRRGAQMDGKGNLPFTITMPCGSSITYPDIDDVPMQDVPCSCGNSDHWFVKYTDEWRDRN